MCGRVHVDDWFREDVRNVGYVGYGLAADVTFQTLDGRLSDSQEDLGLSLRFNCSQEAKVVRDHFARTTSMLRDSTVLGVVNAVCDSGPVLEEFWSDE